MEGVERQKAVNHAVNCSDKLQSPIGINHVSGL